MCHGKYCGGPCACFLGQGRLIRLPGLVGLRYAETALFTSLAMLAFAANSVLCRLALGEGTIDAGSFTVIRLLAGALTLSLIVIVRSGGEPVSSRGSQSAALMLFLYAAAFSWSYISLDTATGALVLFATVQVTMVLATWLAGNRISRIEWAGLFAAMLGFGILLLPGASAPSLSGLALMVVAGVAWARYTLHGRAVGNPLQDTAFNFLRTLPVVILFAVPVVLLTDISMSARGIALAVSSGAVASGVGYAIWYRALGGLTALQAGVVQLSVPVIAALGGILLVSETPDARLVVASVIVLGGIALVFVGRERGGEAQ